MIKLKHFDSISIPLPGSGNMVLVFADKFVNILKDNCTVFAQSCSLNIAK